MGLISDILRDDVKRSVLLLIVAGSSLVASFLVGGGLPVDPAWIAIVLCGTPILWDAVTGLVLRHDIKADVLVAIAIIAAIALGEWFAAGEVALIMEIGGLLEDVSAAKANKGIDRLVSLSPRTGRRVTPDGTEEVPVEEIAKGDVLRVLPGDSIPVDGRVVSGETSVDQSVITGESMPVDKVAGDPVYSGTINQMGSFDMVAERTSSESSFQSMVSMVSSVDADKTRMVRTADRWATWLVALVMVLSLATLLVTQDIYRAVTVLIVFCPCAFILATPTAVVAAIGNLARHGILVKDGDSLERMAEVDVVAFDKTGTMTVGRPSVTHVESVMDDGEFLRFVASAESGSEHPLARVLTDHATSEGIRVGMPDSFTMSIGRGIEAVVDGRMVRVGNSRMMYESGITIPPDVIGRADSFHGRGSTVVFASIDDGYAGFVVFSDSIRESSRTTVSRLNDLGVECVMMTGDNRRVADSLAAAVGVEEVHAECVPSDKVALIEGIQGSGRRVCMVGDGVNDAPALRKAWVGVSMGMTGTDIAADASDMVLVDDGLDSLPHLVGISRRMMSKVRANIVFSLGWNLVAVLLSMMAVLGPVTGALVHNVGSVAVVVNSALLLMYGRRASR